MKLEVEKFINSSPRNFYNNFTVPEQATIWQQMEVKASVTIGGSFENENGDKWTYTELRPFERVAFKWNRNDLSPGSDVTINIILIDYETIKILVEHTDIHDENSLKQLKEYWEWTLDNIKAFLETGYPLNKNDWEGNR